MNTKTQNIKLNGSEYPVNFGLWTLRCFCKEYALKLGDLQNLTENMDFDVMIGLAYHGLKGGARIKKQKFDLTPVAVADLLDQDEEGFEKVMSVFANSSTNGEGEGKKKAEK